MMDLDKFEKSYAYNIRYNYGKEGQQRNWNPHSCMKIISQTVGAQETHGCPFKTLDTNSLKVRLTSYGFSSVHAQEVISYASKGHYQIACSKYFEIMHETTLEEGITHPNQFFEKSQAIIENRTTSDSQKEPGKTPKTKIAKTNRDAFLKKTRNTLMDEYDDDLWNVTQQVETQEKSKADQTAWENEEDDFDMTQVEDYL